MTKRRPIARCVLVLGLLVGSSSSHGIDGSEDEGPRTVVARYSEARAARDMERVGRLLAEGVSLLTSSGKWVRGRDDVLRHMAQSGRQNRADRRIEPEEVQFISEGVALVDARYTLAQGDRVVRLRSTLTLIEEGHAWRIIAIRNMLPASREQLRDAATGKGTETESGN